MLHAYTYQKQPIRFITADNTVYLNATDAGYACGYGPDTFLRHGRTVELIKEMKAKSDNPDMFWVTQEKTDAPNEGVWMRKDLAVFYAQLLKGGFCEFFIKTVAEIEALDATKEERIKALTQRVESLEKQVEVLSKPTVKKAAKKTTRSKAKP